MEFKDNKLDTNYEKIINDILNGLTLYIKNIKATLNFNTLYNVYNLKRQTLYLNIAEKIGWPIYFQLNDDNFCNKIIELFENKSENSIIENYIYDYYNKDFIDSLQEKWKLSKIVSKEKIKILNEALKMHEECNYYSSTAICMCMIYGILIDIDKFLKDNNFMVEDENKSFIVKEGIIDQEKINSEKGKMFQFIISTESSFEIWIEILEYIRTKVLSSSENIKIQNEYPLRNKICHGEQSNYGTKKHSLKSILTIDILFELANEMEQVITK